MPQGLMVFNGSGQVVLDTTTRSGIIIGQVTVTSAASGNVAINNSLPGTYFVLSQRRIGQRGGWCNVWITGNQLYWQWDSGGDDRTNFTCFYGVF